jgi:O-methyltransferase involved in polyketide biosynthesis
MQQNPKEMGMVERGPSQTAIRTAMRRAAHYLLDAEPKILADTYARSLAGFSSDEELLSALRAAPLGDIAWGCGRHMSFEIGMVRTN